jgi:type II secretory pathway pseudopilin PulG
MDTSALILAIVVAVAVVGQLCLPILGRWARSRQERQAKQRIARLLEAAADRQAVATFSQTAKLDGKGGGHE